MRIALLLLLFGHGLLHLLGPARTFGWIDDPALPRVPIPFALVYLAAAACLVTAAASLATRWGPWWLFAAGGVVLSQVAIVASWSAAWAGTLPNAIVLLAALAGFGAWSSRREAAELRHEVVAHATPLIVTDDALHRTPEVVRRWLRRSGLESGSSVQWIHLCQDLTMRLSPEQKRWYEARAEQVMSADPAGFAWGVELRMNPFTRVYGYDRFAAGRSETMMRAFGLVDVADEVSDPDKLAEAAAHRYLAEVAWFPAAALSPAISWRPLDANRAEATLSYPGGSATGTFTFDSSGDFVRFDALRFRKTGPDAEREPWTGRALGYGTFGGMRIPTALEATWRLDDGPWTWLRIEVVDVATDRALAEERRRVLVAGE